MDKRLAYLSIAVGAALWGLIGVFVHHLYDAGFTPVQVVAIRTGTAMFFMLIYLSLFSKHRPALRIKMRDSHYFIGTGVISIVLFNLCLFYAMQVTSISIATILLYTAPAFVTLFSRVLFKEKLTTRKLLALFMTLLGCSLVIGIFPSSGAAVSFYGILLGIGSGFFYAMYSIFGKFALAKYSPLTVTFYTFVFAAMAIIPFSGIWEMTDEFRQGYVWLLVLGIGFFSTMLAFILYTKGLQYVESSKASIIATVEPVVAAFMSFLLFSERLNLWQYTGMILVIIAVIVVQGKKRDC
ncbi:DMT family transporter [Alkalihalobacillus pseudalcaliphilus]|uniref:DMT family transporter n=1 Tax=Alkalihalobacillus pseudalcaliphilus TaxID=79884 RepID=UPI00064E0DF9|nr:EamA family transporter [Alkalihalobacillus pseudalcaliphilus]KMK78118.1 transporter [Alkalihalobacillus pseudalcaliphilus]